MGVPMPPLPDWDTGFEPREACDSRLPYLEFTGALELSASETRQYRLLRLPNNLTVVCVHDADATTAVASLSVNVGGYDEPRELPGLAHFCEHLLLMSSEKYPGEDEYRSYISDHGGDCNAFTDFANTCYYFSITSDALEGALDRFSQFFISPRFDADCVDREVRAVDSEFKGYLQDDGWRRHEIFKATTSSGHRFSSFDVGNLETLKVAAEKRGVDLREELIKYYNARYSADIMNLAIVSRHSLDQMTEWAAAMFSPIASKGDTRSRVEGHPLTADELGTVVRYKTINDVYNIDLEFAFPDMKPMETSGPLSYIYALLNGAGRGSILSIFKERGWATGISAGILSRLHQGYNMLRVTVYATPKGFQSYEGVVRVIFAFVQLMQNSGPQKQFYDELEHMKATNFRFMEKGGAQWLANSLVQTMHNDYLPPDQILSCYYRPAPFDSPLIARILDLLRPGNFRILLGAMDHSVELTEKEKYFGVCYRIDSIPADLAEDLNGPLQLDGLQLPDCNEFLPESLDVGKPVDLPAPAKEPELLKLTNMVEVWFKRDDQFFLPHGYIKLFFENPSAAESALSLGISYLYQRMAYSVLIEDFYSATLAGLGFNISLTDDGTYVRVSGFSDKLQKLLGLILRALKSFKADKARFDYYLESMKQYYQNLKNSDPESIAGWDMYYLNVTPSRHYSVILAELDSITIEKLQSFADHLFDKTRIKMSMVGNFAEEDALATIGSVVDVVKCTPLPEYLRAAVRAQDFRPGSYLRLLPVPDDDNMNSAVRYEIKSPPSASGHREATIISLLANILDELFFDQLRTKEQLGYSVRCSTSLYLEGGSYGLKFNVRSETNPVYLMLRIKAFLHGFRKQLEELAPEKFASLVDSYIQGLEEKLKGISQEAGRFWRHICSGVYDFDCRDKDIAELHSLKQAELLEFWDSYLNAGTAPGLTDVACQVWSTKIPRPSDAELRNYPETSIALFGCLHRDGATELTLQDVDKFVSRVSANVDADTLAAITTSSFAELEELYCSAVEAAVAEGRSAKSAEDIADVRKKMADEALQTKTALAMAIEASAARKPLTNGVASSASSGHGAAERDANLENIGMFKTHGGTWVINDYLAFKNTQPLCGVPLPARRLVPKYPA